MNLKEQLQHFWEKLPAKQRQIVAYVGAGGCVFLLSYLLIGGNSEKKTANQENKKVQREVLAPQRLNDRFGIPGLARELEDIKHDNKELRGLLEKIKETKESRQTQDKAAMETQVRQEVERRVQELRKEEQKNQQAKASPPAQGSQPPRTPLPKSHPDKDKLPSWLPAQAKKDTAKPSAPGLPQVGAHTAKDIRVISSTSNNESGGEGNPGSGGKKGKAKDEEKGTFIPSGSIFSGTLLTGMDAPCGQAAKKDPFPVLLRVKRVAILPNRHTTDVRECFLLASGYGDLSSERVYLRSERFSCIREDGKALENRVEMFASGEDGKAGIRGRVVSKQGAVIGRALLVGFMEGFSKIFGKTPVLTLNIPQNGLQQATPFQRNFSKDSMEAAGVAGVGSALDRLAHYYMDLAGNMFPVVEIDAGREVDFILQSGITLKLQGNI